MTNPTQKPSPELSSLVDQVSVTGMVTAEQFNSYLALMFAKEAKIIQKEEALEQQIAARDEERKRESERYTIAIIENQKACKHLKGGPGRTRGQQRDPAVYRHTFTDGKMHIKCTLCKAKWMPKDTAEYLERSSSKIPNWTKIGWDKAFEMTEESSNRPSSSERFFEGIREQQISDTAREIAKAPNLQF